MQKIETNLPAAQILQDPLLNKGTGFTFEERDLLGLHGLLPYRVSTIEEQVLRRYADFCTRRTEVGKHTFLSALQNRNEVLFYKMVEDHIDEMLPLIYTPTVGDISLQHSTLFTTSRGLYISYPLRDKMKAMVDAVSKKEVDVIVVTDGERILGLGDLGADGMPIPVGKLSLYALFGGIYPGRTLPVLLDVGTNNKTQLDDPMYIGWRHPRITGKDYDDFVDGFVQEIKRKFPKAVLQWEDFGKQNAYVLLERYQNQICSFNDDIQGTAAVVLAAILTAIQKNKSSLKEQRIVVFGGGSAGMGIAKKLCFAMENDGVSKEEAKAKFYIIDRHGLIHTKTPDQDPQQRKFARPFEETRNWKIHTDSHITLEEVVRNVHPTILIGVSAQTGVFTPSVLAEMAAHTKHPIILPLSNPTSKAEATPETILEATKGKAIIATGSPFDPVTFQGKQYPISQCNNVYIFPGLGLGAIVSGACRITEKMLLEASRELSRHSPSLGKEEGLLFPSFRNLREVSKKIAFKVAKAAQEGGDAREMNDSDLLGAIEKKIWTPAYPKICRPSVH